MSIPNRPDMLPDLEVTLEDATNLLLTSIALEEISLSNLINAETNKIKSVMQEAAHGKTALEDAIAINKSVDDTIKSIIKLQMLLQFKLEKVLELLPVTTTSSTTTCSSTTTTTTCSYSTTCSHTTTCTTTCTTSTHSTTTKCWQCHLTGRCRFVVENCEDGLHGGLAELKAYIGVDTKNRHLSYSVRNRKSQLSFFASGNNLKMDCYVDENRAVVYGKSFAAVTSECGPSMKIPVKFELKVWNKKPDALDFQMVIVTEKGNELIHDSGIVRNCKADSDLSLDVCC